MPALDGVEKVATLPLLLIDRSRSMRKTRGFTYKIGQERPSIRRKGKDDEKNVAKLASVKLEEGDIKGAM